MTVAQQGHVFAAMMLCGACIGLIHDLMMVLRSGAVLTAAADLLLGMMAAAGMIAMGLMLRCDPFRWYVFAGAAMGWGIYTATLGLIVRFLMRKCIKLSNKVTK